MKISWNWLNQVIDLKSISQSELAEQLTLAGFEVENRIDHKNIPDIVFEVNITANRPDITSFVSIAIEIAAILKVPLTLYKKTILHNSEIEYRRLSYLDNFHLYKKLNLSIIKNIFIRYSPKWIQNYLISSNINPTNSILDIIHLINFKWGQCIKIFQIDKNIKELEASYKSESSKQKRRYWIKWNKIKASAIELNSENIYEYLNTNINLLITGHIYKNTYIHSKNIKENPRSKKYLSLAYIETINLIQKIYNKDIENKAIYEYENIETQTKSIKCSVSNINKILGPIKYKKEVQYLDKKTIVNILQNLNFVIVDNENELKVEIPDERLNDIQKEIDVTEEIGRIYGFNYFKDYLPVVKKIGKISSAKEITQKIRQILRSMGLHEVLNHSLQSNISDNNIQLVNPLNKDSKKLRTNLTKSLIESVLYNTKQVNEAFEVFEIGKVFIRNYESKITSENLHLAGIIGHNSFCRSEWNQSASELSWFQAKGNLEEFLERMHIDAFWSDKPENSYLIDNIEPYIHPQRTSYIKTNSSIIGLFSQINNRIAKKFGVFYKVYVFEFNVNQLIKSIKKPEHLTYLYKSYSNYPKIIRDISITVNKYTAAQNIINVVNKMRSEENNFLESITIFDEYYETKTTKRIGLRVTYRANHKTLTNKEVEKIEQVFKSKLQKELIKSKS